jgi:hypothetical protein
MKSKLLCGSLLAVLAAALLAGCAPAAGTPIDKPSDDAIQQSAPPAASPAATEPSKPAVAKTESEFTKISAILNDPKAFDGKKVKVQGKIVSECGSGCWFTLQEGNAVLYVDLAPNNMVIAQKKGSTAQVEGEVVSEGSDVYMIGSKVNF